MESRQGQEINFKKGRDSHSVEAELKRKAYLKFSGLSQMKVVYEKQPKPNANQHSINRKDSFHNQSKDSRASLSLDRINI